MVKVSILNEQPFEAFEKTFPGVRIMLLEPAHAAVSAIPCPNSNDDVDIVIFDAKVDRTKNPVRTSEMIRRIAVGILRRDPADSSYSSTGSSQ